MNKILSFVIGWVVFCAAAHASVKIGAPAPEFKLNNSLGKEVSLADYKGKYVVLEWTNFECPFVKYHYRAKNMQNLQQEFSGKDVVWLSIVSSAPGKPGHLSSAEADARKKQEGSKATHLLLDPEGKVGLLYGAHTTPEMFIINPEGNVVYQGALDDAPTKFGEPFKETRNYVREALNQALGGNSIAMDSTHSYGCPIKY